MTDFRPHSRHDRDTSSAVGVDSSAVGVETTGSGNSGRDIPWLSDQEQDFWRLLVAAFRSAEATIEDTLHRRADLTFGEYTVLIALTETADGSMTREQLAARLHWAGDRITRIIDRIASKDLVFSDDEGIHITGKGRGTFADLGPEYVSTVRSTVLANIPDTEREQLRAALESIVSAAGARMPE